MVTGIKFSATSLDKRRWRRVHFTVPVLVTLGKSYPVGVIRSRGSLMNPGGISFSANCDLAIGEEVEVAFMEYQLSLRGVIRNRAGDQYGVEFLAANAEQNQQLGRFRQILSDRLGCRDV